MQNYIDPMIDLQLEGYEVRVYETIDGYLLYSGDYVINTYLHAFETLAEVFAYLALIDYDTNGNGGTPKTIKETMQHLLERIEN
jgi:hypothetical protein